MGYEYKGGGIEALIDCIKGEDISLQIVKDKSTEAIKNYTLKLINNNLEKRVPTLGIENFFWMENLDVKEQYFQMLGHFDFQSYPVYSDAISKMKFQNSKANTYMLWRLYTLVRISQFLDARYRRKTKNFVSRSLLAGICNCTENSVGKIVEEFSRSGMKHAQLFIEMCQDPAEKDIYGALHYSLTKGVPDEYVRRVREELRSFSSLLNKYDKYLKEKVDWIMKSKAVKFAKPVHKLRRNGAYLVRKRNISGSENKRQVKLMWAELFKNL